MNEFKNMIFSTKKKESSSPLDLSSVIKTSEEEKEKEANIHFDVCNFVPPTRYELSLVDVTSTGPTCSMLPDENRFNAVVNKINENIIKSNKKDDFCIKKTTCWLSRLIEQKGEDYIYKKLSVDEVSRNSERIINDIISGRIDYNKYGKFIIMPVILETLINYVSNKLSISKAVQLSLGYTYNDYVNYYSINDQNKRNDLEEVNRQISNISQAIVMYNQDVMVYSVLFDKLMYVRDTKNACILFNIASELNMVKRQIQNRY